MALEIDRPHPQWLRILGSAVLVGLRLMILCSAAVGATPDEIRTIIAEETAKNGQVPLSLALAVAKVESDLRPDAVSSAGARGVMQIMPATAMGEFGVPASALADPRVNVRLGVAYLERLYNRYGGDWEMALSHYNGGSLPMASGQSGAKQFVAHDYTRQYVADVMKWDAVYRNDATMLAVAGGTSALPEAPVQLASVEPSSSADRAPEPVTAIRETVVPETSREASMPQTAAAPAYPPLDELRARFRAHFDPSTRPAPVQTAQSDAPAATATAAPARSGRFSYRPYGS